MDGTPEKTHDRRGSIAAVATSALRQASRHALQSLAAVLLSIIAMPFVVLLATVALAGDGYPGLDED